jgi:hypothetical protein
MVLGTRSTKAMGRSAYGNTARTPWRKALLKIITYFGLRGFTDKGIIMEKMSAIVTDNIRPNYRQTIPANQTLARYPPIDPH